MKYRLKIPLQEHIDYWDPDEIGITKIMGHLRQKGVPDSVTKNQVHWAYTWEEPFTPLDLNQPAKTRQDTRLANLEHIQLVATYQDIQAKLSFSSCSIPAIIADTILEKEYARGALIDQEPEAPQEEPETLGELVEEFALSLNEDPEVAAILQRLIDQWPPEKLDSVLKELQITFKE